MEYFKRHYEKVLVAAAALIIFAIIYVFIWGMSILLVNIDKAVTINKGSAKKVEFKINEAKKILDLRVGSSSQ